MTTAGKLRAFVSLVILLAVISIGWSLNIVRVTRVHGPYYQRIVAGKDIIADILPPPEYIVESYLTALQMIDSQESGQLEEFKDSVERMHRLKAEHEARHVYWDEALEVEGMRSLLLEEAYFPAKKFFEEAEQQLIPLCQSGKLSEAKTLLRGSMKVSYEQHRDAVDRLVVTATAYAADNEKAVSSEVLWQTVALATFCGVGVLLVIGFGARFIRGTLVLLETAGKSVAVQSGELKDTASSIETAVRELEQSIREISQNTTGAVNICQKASESVGSASGTLHQLGDDSRQIGDIIKVIQQITHQTNLLALNATIEAARAGDSGRGFAVVAREVKDLAKQTSEAAVTITQQIEAIQSRSQNAVSAIELVSDVMEEIRHTQTAIASAVEQQTAMTSDLGRSVQVIAENSRVISENIETLQGRENQRFSSHNPSEFSKNFGMTAVAMT
ncbi:MAG: hypothetical protein JNL58_19675 [Planctomyces sp.]|nr:hypothetical protein [Planctomyces sp.]